MSGYSKEQTARIVTAGLVGYENMKAEAEKKSSGLHKSASEGAVERRRKKFQLREKISARSNLLFC